jgi:hypothetical protein
LWLANLAVAILDSHLIAILLAYKDIKSLKLQIWIRLVGEAEMPLLALGGRFDYN